VIIGSFELDLESGKWRYLLANEERGLLGRE